MLATVVHEEDGDDILEDTGLVDQYGEPLVRVYPSQRQGFMGFVPLGSQDPEDEGDPDDEEEGR